MTAEEVQRSLKRMEADGEAESFIDSNTGKKKWRLTAKGIAEAKELEKAFKEHQHRQHPGVGAVTESPHKPRRLT